MWLYFSAYSMESNSGFIVVKGFIVLCNEDTKHLVEISLLNNLLYILQRSRRYKGIQSDFYKTIYSKKPYSGTSVLPRDFLLGQGFLSSPFSYCVHGGHSLIFLSVYPTCENW